MFTQFQLAFLPGERLGTRISGVGLWLASSASRRVLCHESIGNHTT